MRGNVLIDNPLIKKILKTLLRIVIFAAGAALGAAIVAEVYSNHTADSFPKIMAEVEQRHWEDWRKRLTALSAENEPAVYPFAIERYVVDLEKEIKYKGCKDAHAKAMVLGYSRLAALSRTQGDEKRTKSLLKKAQELSEKCRLEKLDKEENLIAISKKEGWQ